MEHFRSDSHQDSGLVTGQNINNGDELDQLLARFSQHAEPNAEMIETKLPSQHSDEKFSTREIALLNQVLKDNPEYISEEVQKSIIQKLIDDPEKTPPELIMALGEWISLDAANEAAIRSRVELSKYIEEHPQHFHFMKLYIDRINQTYGFRLVPDKEINQAIMEIKLEEARQKGIGAITRAWEAFWGKERTDSLSEQLENIYATKLTLEKEVQDLRIKLSALKETEKQEIKSLESEVAERRLEIAREHQKMIADQIVRQEGAFKQLQEAQEKLQDVRRQYDNEAFHHRQLIEKLRNEILQLKAEKAEVKPEAPVINESMLASKRAEGIAEAFMQSLFSTLDTRYWHNCTNSMKSDFDFRVNRLGQLIKIVNAWREKLEDFELNITDNNELDDFAMRMLKQEDLRSEFKHAIFDLMHRKIPMSGFLDRFNSILQIAIDKSS